MSNQIVSYHNRRSGFTGGGVSTEPIHWWNLDDDGVWADNGSVGGWTLSETNTGVITDASGPSGQTVADFRNVSGGVITNLVAGNKQWDGANLNTISVFAWIYDDSGYGPGSSAGCIVDWRLGGSSSTADVIAELQTNNTNALYTRVGDGYTDGDGGDKAVVYLVGELLPEDTWYHIGFTFDGSTIRQYKNASETGSNTNNLYDNIPTNACPFCIGALGRASTNTNFWFRGFTGMIGIWDVALTTDDISALYNGGSGLQYDGSVWS